VFMR